jgi:hypothetical protein
MTVGPTYEQSDIEFFGDLLNLDRVPLSPDHSANVGGYAVNDLPPESWTTVSWKILV